MEQKLEQLVCRAESLLERVESVFLPSARTEPAWHNSVAFRWRRDGSSGFLDSICSPHGVRLASLRNIDSQKEKLDRNTRQFLAGLPANDALLWGSRGTGKSSLVKSMLTEYAEFGLRIIEVEAHNLIDLPQIVDVIHDRPERFILFCDDLSFEADDPSYKSLKATLEGSISAKPDNVLIYATSNRRHLVPEYLRENEESRVVGGEIHHGDAVEEKVSLSERFGLWLAFHPFDQARYLDICFNSLREMGIVIDDPDIVSAAALKYCYSRGSRSGRVAWQFARDWAGQIRLNNSATELPEFV